MPSHIRWRSCKVWFEHYEAKEYPILVEDTVRGWGSLSPFVERAGFRHTAICSVYVAEAARGHGAGHGTAGSVVGGGAKA